MSTFWNFETAQTGTIIAGLQSLNPTGQTSINTIAITNTTPDSASLPNCDVLIYVDQIGNDPDIPVCSFNIPQQATAIYDIKFTLQHTQLLRLTTNNNSTITVIIN